MTREILQIIRRYQSSFNLLNKQINPSELSKAQMLAFQICVTPKCSKLEFQNAIKSAVYPVYLEQDCIDIQISLLKGKYLIKEKTPIIIIRNREVNVYLRQILLVKLKQSDIDEWLLGFLKIFETCAHQLLEKAIQKHSIQLYEIKEDEGNKWSNIEQQRLEHSVRLYKNIKDDSKWEMIADIIETRKAAQCKKQIIQMAQKDKTPDPQPQQEEEKDNQVKDEIPDIHLETEEIREAIRNLQNYKRATIQLLGLKMSNIGTMFLQNITFSCQCLGCNGQFNITCKLLSLKQKILSFDSPCPVCKRNIKLYTNYQFMHQQNVQDCATVAAVNVKVNELKGINYAFTCATCDKTYIQNQNTLTFFMDLNCMECYVKTHLEFQNHIMYPYVAAPDINIINPGDKSQQIQSKGKKKK
ncbi:UNKNOWN [Stylonychia lemnae]|uniref:Myb-like domain-containing protein n=1 Tax=Stylonychia lemnae TaxID=5949 RepID=A0A078AUE5_STYLE|nr:UNKNOWN [Stylonychia lemnae]|eukprot:CDW85631.1 UNKNOWN [Stylonychia lemnae]